MANGARLYTKTVNEWLKIMERIQDHPSYDDSFNGTLDQIDETIDGNDFGVRVTVDLSGADCRVERWMDLAP